MMEAPDLPDEDEWRMHDWADVLFDIPDEMFWMTPKQVYKYIAEKIKEPETIKNFPFYVRHVFMDQDGTNYQMFVELFSTVAYEMIVERRKKL